ncbi:helix-turn-helix domain-containing protein [Streptomyces sp. NPDC046203]|uniref:helix-turn-helix domain-containing protein n=1 Tax=Streptomyces sp. NPDC046203 TaxID=3154602 RepID=UPI0033D75537
MDSKNPSLRAGRTSRGTRKNHSSGAGGIQHDNFRHDDGFVMVGNHLAQHGELSLVAIGLSTHLQSLPAGAPADIKHLAKRFPEGAIVIADALRELEAHGYMNRPRLRGAKGQVATHLISCNNPARRRALDAACHDRSAGGAEPGAGGASRGDGTAVEAVGPPVPPPREPERVPESIPESIPEWIPEWIPEPAPEPVPEPEVSAPAPEPRPVPDPVPGPVPQPAPGVTPVAAPDPASGPVPVPAPVPASAPEAVRPPRHRSRPEARRRALPDVPAPSSLPPELLLTAAEILARLARVNPRLLLSGTDTEHLTPGVIAWLERDASADAVVHALTDRLPYPLHRPAALLAHRLTANLPPPPPFRPVRAKQLPLLPLQNCERCDRAFRGAEPGCCPGCQHKDTHGQLDS